MSVFPGKMSVLIDNQGISTVINYFKGTRFQPVIREEHVDRVQNIVEVANKKKYRYCVLNQGLKNVI